MHVCLYLCTGITKILYTYIDYTHRDFYLKEIGSQLYRLVSLKSIRQADNLETQARICAAILK